MKKYLCATCLGACIGGLAALALRSYSSGLGPNLKPAAGEAVSLEPKTSLGGILYLEKSKRLAIYWKNGDFELWDTEQGGRLGRVEKLPRRVGWCVASPDEKVILTADAMAEHLNPLDQHLTGKEFVPSITIWDTKSGERKRSIQMPEAAGIFYFTHEWYARWLDDSHALLVRLQRKNPARGASYLRLIILDTAAGKVVKASEEFEWAGEHLFLSPDRKMALVKDDNYRCRANGPKEPEGMYRNIYARTHVFDVERLSIVSSWGEPPIFPGKAWNVALIARWCPDGKTILTVSGGQREDHFASQVSLWDARRGQLIRTISTGHKDHIMDVAFTDAGDKLLTASEDHTIRVWIIRTGKLEKVLSGHAASLNEVVVLPGDKLAVSVAEEPVAKVWDLTTGKLKFDLPGHDSAVRDVEVVSDHVVRTVTLQGTATTWDCSTGKQLRVAPKPPDFPKRFGVCELVEEKGALHMRIVNQAPIR